MSSFVLLSLVFGRASHILLCFPATDQLLGWLGARYPFETDTRHFSNEGYKIIKARRPPTPPPPSLPSLLASSLQEPNLFSTFLPPFSMDTLSLICW